MQRCPTCERKTRVKETRKKINKKQYWIAACVKCDTPLDLEEIQGMSDLEVESRKQDRFLKGWFYEA